MKTPKYLIMGLIVLTIIQMLASSCTSQSNKPHHTMHPDSIEFTVWRAKTLDNSQILPVYIESEESQVYRTGDTVVVNSHNVIPAILKVRSSEEPAIKPEAYQVVRLIRVSGTKTFSRDQAESQQ